MHWRKHLTQCSLSRVLPSCASMFFLFTNMYKTTLAWNYLNDSQFPCCFATESGGGCEGSGYSVCVMDFSDSSLNQGLGACITQAPQVAWLTYGRTKVLVPGQTGSTGCLIYIRKNQGLGAWVRLEELHRLLDLHKEEPRSWCLDQTGSTGCSTYIKMNHGLDAWIRQAPWLT